MQFENVHFDRISSENAVINGHLMTEERVAFTVCPELILLSTFIQQCDMPYSSNRYIIKEPSGQESSIYTEDGDVCIAPDVIDPTETPEFDEVVTIKSDTKDSEHESLFDLTIQLQEVTEKTNNMKITDFEITWGISKASQYPYMMNVNGCLSSDNDVQYLIHIALCLAIETSISIEPGKCINPDRDCVGSDCSIQRKKFEVHRIRRFFESGYETEQVNDAVNLITKKMTELEPGILLKNVPCCKQCFRIYSRTLSAQTRGVQITRSSQTTSTRPKEAPAGGEFRPFAKTKSGLTVTQATSSKTHKQAHKLYSIGPFPPFRQHK